MLITHPCQQNTGPASRAIGARNSPSPHPNQTNKNYASHIPRNIAIPYEHTRDRHRRQRTPHQAAEESSSTSPTPRALSCSLTRCRHSKGSRQQRYLRSDMTKSQPHSDSQDTYDDGRGRAAIIIHSPRNAEATRNKKRHTQNTGSVWRAIGVKEQSKPPSTLNTPTKTLPPPALIPCNPQSPWSTPETDHSRSFARCRHSKGSRQQRHLPSKVTKPQPHSSVRATVGHIQ